MRAILLISDNGTTLELIRLKCLPELRLEYEVSDHSSLSVEFHRKSTFLSVTDLSKKSSNGATLDMYEEDMQALIKKAFDAPNFFLVQFRPFEIFKLFNSKLIGCNILIDNEFGRLLSPAEVSVIQGLDEFES